MKYRYIFITSLVIALCLCTHTTEASSTYVTLTNLPFGNNIDTSKPADIATFINQVIQWAIALAAALAVVQIVWGGILKMTSESIIKQGDGTDRIKSAIYGLLIALTSYLLLNTINPNLTNLTLNVRPVNVQSIQALPVGAITGAPNAYIPGTPGTVIEGTPNPLAPYSTDNYTLTPTTDGGYTITPNRVALDTDGTNPPPFVDADSASGPGYQNTTALGGLDANIHPYVVVPIGSNIPLGSNVLVTDNTTGKSVWAVVGDRGQTQNGYGEASLAALRDVGAWTPGMGNSTLNHNITYTFYPKK